MAWLARIGAAVAIRHRKARFLKSARMSPACAASGVGVATAGAGSAKAKATASASQPALSSRKLASPNCPMAKPDRNVPATNAAEPAPRTQP